MGQMHILKYGRETEAVTSHLAELEQQQAEVDADSAAHISWHFGHSVTSMRQ